MDVCTLYLSTNQVRVYACH